MKGELKMARIETRETRLSALVSTALLGCALLVVPAVAEDIEAIVSSSGPPGTLEFVGKNLIMAAKGTFHEWRVVESSVDMDAIDDAFVLVEVELSSVDTGIERRDDHLRNSDFFEVETYPVATVRIHSPRIIEDENREPSRFTVQFDVNLHGVEKTLDGEIVLIGTDPLIFEGNLTIDRMEFGVGPKPGFWSPMVPKAEIPVTFHVAL
jgi:polyisoprenoid-binding protein YceI